MQMVTIKKSQFVSLNDKRYYFSDGITSLPYGHILLNKLREKKKKYKQFHKYIQEFKYEFLKEETKVANKCKIILILRSTLSQPFTCFKLDSAKRPLMNKSSVHSTRDYILNGYWL